MKQKVFIIHFFLSAISLTYAQNTRLNNWFIESGIGLLQYEWENNFKFNAYQSSAFVGKSFAVGKNSSLSTGVKLATLKGGFYDYGFSSNFISLPVLFRYHSNSSNNAMLYFGVGVDNKFKINEKFENVVLSTAYKVDNGYHLGGIAEFGYRTKVVNNIDFQIGIGYSEDLVNLGYSNNGAYKMSNGVQLTLGFDIYSQKQDH